MHHLSRSVTRRSFIVRGLGLFAALAGPHLAGEQLHAVADKKGKKKYSKIQIAQRAQASADLCAETGGTAITDAKPGGVTVTCSHSDGSSRTCTYHSKGVRCSSAASNPGTLPDFTPTPQWANPADVPNVPLQPTEPTLRSGRSSRRRSKK